jgi:hypothetical protein
LWDNDAEGRLEADNWAIMGVVEEVFEESSEAGFEM